MKIALAFFGITRSLKYTIESIKKNILEPLSEHSVDIYMHTYHLKQYNNIRTREHKENYDNKEYKLLNPTYLKIEEQEIVKNKIGLLKYRTHKDPWNTNYNSVDNFILAQYSKYQLVSMINGNYDYIIFIRPDCLYLEPLKINYLKAANPTTIVIPNFHLNGPYQFNDRFAITTSETYKKYGGLFESLLKISKKQPLHSETVMGEEMKELTIVRIPFHFSRVRVNGNVHDNFKLKISTKDRINFYLGYSIFKKINNTEYKYSLSPVKEENYIVPLHKLMEKNNLLNKKYCLFIGDNNIEQPPEYLVKNRFNSNHSVILRCLNIDRHWNLYYNKPPDIPFEAKINTVFWRGSTTGQSDRPGNRFTLVKRWFHHPRMNIGLSNICQDKDEYKIYVKGKAKIKDFLNYKYILSVEGNDKDSGIQWKLNSNSLVMMAKPRCTSWLMETTLIPNYHYVLLKDDFSDLEEKVHWCNKHPKKCKEMIQNANEYMKQFSDEKKEQEIENEVIKEYFKRIE